MFFKHLVGEKMSVIVKIIGEKNDTDEYIAAEKLKNIIDSTVPQNVMGEIILFPSATLFGQAVKDVDIMMIGDLKNYNVNVSFFDDNVKEYIQDEVSVISFCTTIEVKGHPITSIRKEGTNLLVLYTQGWHNATKQSNDQKTSAMNFFTYNLGFHPYITNLIWFTEVTKEELSKLLIYNDKEMLSNALPNYYSFNDLMQLLVYQKIPKKINNKLVFDCSFGGKDSDSISKPLSYFSKVKKGVGTLTRKRIEQITNSELNEYEPQIKENSLNILRGRAGTGKTINLIRFAIKLVDEKGARVQILTYNRALVSDIRRLFAFAELPDMFEEKCVSVNTMQSYFFGLINGCLYDGKLDGEDYLNRYDELLKEMVEFLDSDIESKNIIKAICEDNPKLNWDYILIDEAQDWSENERILILKLYDEESILVADGGKQFVRSVVPCDWSIVKNRNPIKLKQCLRQKRNIIKYINHFSNLYSMDSSIIPSENLIGGRVVIIKDRNKLFHTLKTERVKLKEAGNDSYDFLFLVPSSLVDNNGDKHFKLIKEFEKNDFLLWDGTNDNNRLDYSIDLEESRVLQYESARGLEGWSVCCMNFDEFLDEKEKQYNPSIQSSDILLLESSEERKNKYITNWALIPMTRAIDTLIITLKDPESNVSRQLLDIAQKCQDFVEII